MHSPYLLIPLGILAVFFYLLSYLLVRLSIWSIATHRKIWNTILLLVFIPATILGLLLVIQINYNLEWQIVNKLLRWHVETGIAFSFTAIFHILWHLSYYLNLFKRKKHQQQETLSGKKILLPDIKKQQILIFLSGFVSTTIQVLVIRELSSLFQGNEFIMGWTLGAWMLLTALGTFSGKNINPANISKKIISTVYLVVIISPVLTIVLLNFLKNSIFLPGVEISPVAFIGVCLLSLIPVCFFTGLLFALFVKHPNYRNKEYVKVYAMESIGSVFGGLIVSFLLIQWFSIIISLLLLIILSGVVLFYIYRQASYLILSISTIILSVIFSYSNAEIKLKSIAYQNQNVIESTETFYGNLTVTENAGEYSFFNNGSLIYSSGDFISAEESAHYAMLQRQAPKNVLIISGGVSGIASEVLKYKSVENIFCLEMNRKLIRLGKKYNLIPENKKIKIIYGDTKQFFSHNSNKFDIVIMAVPNPSSLQANRYYTVNFLKELKQKLNKNAVIIYRLPSTGNYISDAQSVKLSVLLNTLKTKFTNVNILPGENDYLLASDSTISLAISELYEQSKPNNLYVNSNYIDDASIASRSRYILSNIKHTKAVNTNNHPLPVFYETLRFISKYSKTQKLFLYLPLLLLLIPFFFMKTETSVMYSAGFSGASIELLLIFAFQTAYGYVYSAIGLIVALFMAGLAIGSILGYKYKTFKYQMVVLQGSLIVYLLLLPVIFHSLNSAISDFLLYPVFIVGIIIPSTIIGYLFVTTSEKHKHENSVSASIIYTADLLGSSLGVIITTIIMVPVLGITSTCIILAVFNLISGLKGQIEKIKFRG